MKKISYIGIGLGLLLMSLVSCEMRDELKKLPEKEGMKEEGWFSLDVASTAKSDQVASRAIFAADDVNPLLYPVDIINALTGEIVFHYATYADLLKAGQKIRLTAGRYRVVAYNYDGSQVNASERPYFKGITEFEVLAGKTTKVNTTCRLQNVAVSIALSTDFTTKFQDDYSITVTNGDGGVKIYSRTENGKTLYFKVPDQKNSVQLVVKATTKTNVQIAQNYSVVKPNDAEGNSNLVSGDEFTVNVGVGDEPSVDPTTQIKLEITVDLTMHATGVTIEIPTENIIFNESGTPTPDPTPDPTPGSDTVTLTGVPATYTFSSAGVQAGTETVPPIQINIAAPKGITKLMVAIHSTNVDFTATLESLKLNVPFDLANPGELLWILETPLADGGIGLIAPNDPIRGKTAYLFDITSFMSLLSQFGAGDNTFTITVGDGVHQDVTGVLTVNVTQ